MKYNYSKNLDYAKRESTSGLTTHPDRPLSGRINNCDVRRPQSRRRKDERESLVDASWWRVVGLGGGGPHHRKCAPELRPIHPIGLCMLRADRRNRE